MLVYIFFSSIIVGVSATVKDDILKDDTGTKSLLNLSKPYKDYSCIDGETIKDDCNTCWCDNNHIVCTLMECPKIISKTIIPDNDGLPILNRKKCEPGQIYKQSAKSCQRCYCNDRSRPMCTRKPCSELQNRAIKPGDVYPEVSDENLKYLPSIPLDTKCSIGKVYKDNCNICFCMYNYKLLCDKKWCGGDGK